MPKGTPLANNDDEIYKLQKLLYGLKQAPREWNNYINEFLITSGFQRMEVDSCIYVRLQWDEAAQCNKYSVEVLYVDDLIIACSTIQMCKDLEKKFKKKYHMKILGDEHILGMDVEINPVTHVVHVSQAEYVKKSVRDYSKYKPNSELKSYSTPIESRQPLYKTQSPEASTEEALRMQSLPYHELIGTLLWIANGTRPEISYAVGTLAKYTNNPAELH
jgi:Reverse transcriptase (RNA-dependent DNA polymerase)